MSRQRFGTWGAELDEVRFGSALAGAMAGVRVTGPRTDTVRANSPLRKGRPTSTAALAAWQRAERPCRFEIPLGLPRQLQVSERWLVQTLRRAPGVNSVTFIDPQATGPRRAWDWPVDVGLFDDPASRSLRAAIEAQYWQRFVRFVDAERADRQFDLLLLPESLNEGIARLGRGTRLADVHTVLVLGGVDRSADPLAALALLRSEARALGAGVLEVPTDTAKDWLDRTLFQLSHDLCLDEALFQSTDSGSPLLFSPSGAFSEAHAAAVAERMAASPKRSKRPASEVFSPDLLARAHIAPDAPLGEVTKSLVEKANAIGWHSEGEAASLVAAVGAAPGDDGDSDPDSAGPRFVQARLFVGKREIQTLVSGAVHRLDVRIGLPSQKWTRAPLAFPAEQLPQSDAGHLLTVVLSAPALLDAPRTETVLLPPTGSSKPCSFHLLIPKEIAALDARVTVLFENRILQTLRVRGDAEHPLVIELESALRPRLSDLSASKGFDVSFLLNDHEDGKGIVAFAGTDVAYVRMTSVEALRDNLKAQLEKVTKAPKDYADPASDQTRELYVTLARSGWLFKRRLGELPGMKAALAHVGEASARIQVMSLHPDDIVPLELVYDAPYPKETATLCSGLRRGTPCGPSCGSGPEVVCGLGFWGIRHVVERRLYDENTASELAKEGADYAFAASPSAEVASLRPLSNVVFASSDRAASFDAPAFGADVAEIEKAFVGAHMTMVTAKDWADWDTQVAKARPELLLFITHTEERMGDAAMEIGDAQFRSSGEITPDTVGPVKEDEPGPIVFLLGCRTAQEEVPYGSLVSAFRMAKASVVLGTLSTVRGRHMAPVARAAVEHLLAHAQGPGIRFGEVVRDLRRSLIQRGLPVGLTLVSFGEVDWKIGGSA